ncbi:hypothetical protein KGM_211248 [Danaus plexippus plexippus]|uniref:Uncharacterized protein n=1 Tax=Danaus plexippus plexippus TaxID=278856 RepID=A0A212FBX6_DANPL|nr:hypothetical protein KGM_211248 [Danaus plexippus plexippus]
MQSLALLLMALSAVLAAPALVPAPLVDDEYPLAERREYADQIIVPQKRAALVLDRLLIALQKALHDEAVGQRLETDREGPRTAPLRIANFDNNDVFYEMALEVVIGLQATEVDLLFLVHLASYLVS